MRIRSTASDWIRRLRQGVEVRMTGLDDVECLSSDCVFEHDGDGKPLDALGYLVFEVVERPAGGQAWHGFRAIKVSELKYLPQEARADASLIRKQAALIRGLYASGVEMIALHYGIFDPPLGIVQCYGAAARHETKEVAIQLAESAHAAVITSMTAQYPQSRFSSLTIQRGRWLWEALKNMGRVTTLIGQPDPRESARGELLRRALGSKNASEALAGFHAEFIQGALAQGVNQLIAEKVWDMIAGFAGYSFSKAHAGAFAVIVYWSAWLRVHYPAEYFCGLLRNAPLGTYPPNVLESEARRNGIRFLPFDINRSRAKATVEAGAIRFGLDYVKGIGTEQAEALVETRAAQPIRSLADFVERTGLDRRRSESLILAGAFDSLGERRQLLWDLAEAFDLARRPKPLPLHIPDEHAAMHPMAEDQKLALTFAATGVTAGMHLVEVRRDAFTRAGCWPYHQLLKTRIGSKVKVGGLVADGVRRPPTANGTAFLRLDSPDGIMDVIIPEGLYLKFHDAFHSAFLVVEGKLQQQHPVISILAKKVEPLK